MILRKQEKDNIIRAMYASSTVCGSIFDKSTRDLTIIFNNGSQYKYPNVDLTDYTRFELAESNGSVFTSHIRTKYKTFEKLDKMDVTSMLQEITEIAEKENKEKVAVKAKTLMAELARLLTSYLSTDTINEFGLDKIEKMIIEYKSMLQPKVI